MKLTGSGQDRKRLAMKACTGPGKSTLLAWVGWHRLLCFADKGEHPKGAALSGEGRDNLRDNLWSELSKWQQRSELLTRAFTWNNDRVYANDHSETWFLSARSYSKDADAEAIGRSLSGLHSRYPFILLDETGDMPTAVGQKATQIFTGGCVDGLIAAAGNPTSTNGLLYYIWTTERELWDLVTVTADPDDPKRTPRVSIEHAREQIQLHGRDNPWVQATILGEFPAHGFNTLLSINEVEAAMGRAARPETYQHIQKRLGVDVARFGDDRTMIFPRQGAIAYAPIEMRNARNDQIAARVAVIKSEFGSEAEFVDGTGGYGGGVVDCLLQAGHNPLEINASSSASDPRYYNKRSETWFRMAEWVKRAGCLPNLPGLAMELAAPKYTFRNGLLLLESKDQIKSRIKRSPDCFVAGTLIRTPRGQVPIESIREGDVVCTPMGVRQVVHTWESESDQITTAAFSNGASLSGKGKHEVFTWDAGWVRLDGLVKVNGLESDSLTRRAAWFLRRSFTRANPTGFKALVGTISQDGIMTRSAFFIGGFGSRVMDPFQMGCRSIIGMATGLTAHSRILNSFMAPTTGESTCSSGCATQPFEHAPWLGSTAPNELRSHGTKAQRVSHGTSSTARYLGRGVKQNQQSAAYVESSSRPTSPPVRAFAQRAASKRNPFSDTRRRLVSACSAVKRFVTTSIGLSRVVPVSVEAVTEHSGRRVYNLTLNADNAYYANGILVANCADALALTFSLPDMPSSNIGEGHQDMGKVKSDWDPYADR